MAGDISADVTIETLQPLSFNGVAIPFERRIVSGGGRHHTHEFPHSPGGENEKLGRSLYRVQLYVQAHDRPGEPMGDIYGDDFYTTTLPILRILFEQQATRELVVPGYGTWQAFCTNWTQTLDARITSGEEVVLEFIEDTEFAPVAPRFSPADLSLAADQLLVPLPEMPQIPSIFQQINDLVGTLGEISAAGDIANQLLAAKLVAIVNMCASAEETVHELQDPLNFTALTALKDVALAASDWADDVNARATPINTYTTTRKMSLNEISIAIYNDATHIEELLDLNAIDDDVAVPAGTPIRFYRVES